MTTLPAASRAAALLLSALPAAAWAPLPSASACNVPVFR
jgi:hypothetical protein